MTVVSMRHNLFEGVNLKQLLFTLVFILRLAGLCCVVLSRGVMYLSDRSGFLFRFFLCEKNKREILIKSPKILCKWKEGYAVTREYIYV